MQTLSPKSKKMLACAAALAVLLLTFAVNFWLNYRYFIDLFLDFDGAAEIRLAMTMHENGEWIFSSNWYYSTELRFLHNQLVMVPLFRFLNSPIGVHLAATVLVQVLMAGSAVFCFRSMAVGYWQSFLAATIVISPFSYQIMYMNLTNCYYSFFIAGTLFFWGLYCYRVRSTSRFGRAGLSAGLYFLSFCMGLCGVRYLLLVFAPLMLISVLNSTSRLSPDLRSPRSAVRCVFGELVRPFSCFVAYCAGYLLYQRVLLQHYPVADLENKLTISSPGDIISKLRQVPELLISILAPTYDVAVLSLPGLFLLFKLALMAVVLVFAVLAWLGCKQQSEPVQQYTSFSWCVFLVSVLAMACTNDYHTGGDTAAARYLVPGLMPLLTLPLLYWNNRTSQFKKRLLCLASVLVMCACNLVYAGLLPGRLQGYTHVAQYHNRVMENQISILQQQGYTGGYSSDQYAGIIQVLSNNQIDVVGVYARPTGFSYRTWLEPKNPERLLNRDGPRFLVLTPAEYESCSELVGQLDILYDDPAFVILHLRGEDIAAILA